MRLAIFLWTLLIPVFASAEVLQTLIGPVEVEKRVTGLDEPWSIAFLPDGGLLITEREGRLLYFSSLGSASVVAGVPEVFSHRQGGLFDVVIARDFAQTRRIFLTYAARLGRHGATTLAEARLSPDAARLVGLRVLYQQPVSSSSGVHFGGRVVEAADGSLFLTVGERGERALAQDLGRSNGKVIHLTAQGLPHPDNPDIGSGALPEIWSYGHRNPQGASLDLEGRFVIHEHGPRGGDEVNRPEPGLNYGWPIISHGKEYVGGQIGIGTEAPGMEQPLWHWTPSIAPSGMVIYSGRLWPEWRGHLFAGSLKFDMISRLAPEGEAYREVERLFQDRFERIRDIREAPDGSIWFLSVGDRAAYRIVPAD